MAFTQTKIIHYQNFLDWFNIKIKTRPKHWSKEPESATMQAIETAQKIAIDNDN